MRLLKELVRERSGNFGLLTAILMVPLIGAAGMALDVSHAISLRTELIGIADAAALGAISEGTAGFKAAKSMTQDGEIQIAQTDGRKLFLAQRGGNYAGADLSEVGLEVSMKVVRKDGAINSVAVFTADVPTMFLRILGKETISISGAATAAYGAQAKSFTNFYMLLDNTPSMGIAATRKDMAKMEALTGANGGRACALACHVGYYGGDGKFNEDANSTYNVARANGITLRIDVVAKAVGALINKVKSEMANSADQYRIAAYSFGKFALEPGYRIDKISPLTVDMASASKATGDVGLMTTDHDHFNQNALTSFEASLTAIGKEISGSGGTGSSAADPQKIVYFVTDGMGDGLKSSTCSGSWFEDKGRCLEPIDTKYCTALKDRGIKIAVLYTTYIPLDGDHIWDTYISKVFAGKIATQLKACASEELFFEVGPDDDMQDAMVNLFVKSASGATNLRLTQ